MKQLSVVFILLVAFVAGAQDKHNEISYSPGILSGPSVQRIKLHTGIEIEYAEQGNLSGIPVILLHGISDSWHSFEGTLPLLPPDLRVFALSQRGHGNSEQPEQGYSPKNFADDVAAFISQKNLGPVIIAGHSMGGVHAIRFAADYPELCRALVIIDSDPFFHLNEGVNEFRQSVMAIDTITREFMTAFQASTIVKPLDEKYFNLVVDEAMKVPARIFKAALAGMLDEDFTGQIEKITIPVLLFWGDKDSVCLRAGQETMTRVFPSSRLIIYENTGHALHWEEPREFAKDLVQFIHQVSRQ